MNRFEFFRQSDRFLIIDHDSGIQIQMTDKQARSLARHLMTELNIIDAILRDGRNLLEIDEKFARLVKERFNQEEISHVSEKIKGNT